MSIHDLTSVRFHGLELEAAPGRVFTPRAATEALVDAALARRPVRVADIGTGTGAVAVTLAARDPRVEVWATDASPLAVELAERNARRHGVADRVRVLHADLLDGVPDELDLVVANLPYLPPEAADRYRHEPRAAVVSGERGLALYRRLLAAAPAYLARHDAVVLQFHGEVLTAERDELAA